MTEKQETPYDFYLNVTDIGDTYMVEFCGGGEEFDFYNRHVFKKEGLPVVTKLLLLYNQFEVMHRRPDRLVLSTEVKEMIGSFRVIQDLLEKNKTQVCFTSQSQILVKMGCNSNPNWLIRSPRPCPPLGPPDERYHRGSK